MGISTRTYGNDTSLTQSYPWGIYVGGRALCSDGRSRNLKRIADTADTFYSIPASVTVKGYTIAGYVTIDDDDSTVKFHPYTYRMNGAILPRWPCDCRQTDPMAHCPHD